MMNELEDHLNPLNIYEIIDKILEYIEGFERLKELRFINSIWSAAGAKHLKRLNSKRKISLTLTNRAKLLDFLITFKNKPNLYDAFTFQPYIGISPNYHLFMDFISQFGNKIRSLVLDGYSIKEVNETKDIEETHLHRVITPSFLRQLVLQYLQNIDSIQFEDVVLEKQIFRPEDNLTKFKKLAFYFLPCQLKQTLAREFLIRATNLKEIHIKQAPNFERRLNSYYGLFSLLKLFAELKMNFETFTIDTIDCNYQADFPPRDFWEDYDFSTIKFKKLQFKSKFYDMRKEIQLLIFFSLHPTLSSIEEFTEEIEEIIQSPSRCIDYIIPFPFHNLKVLTLKFPPTFVVINWQIGEKLSFPQLETLTIMNCIMEVPFNSFCYSIKNLSFLDIVGLKPLASYRRNSTTFNQFSRLRNLKNFDFRLISTTDDAEFDRFSIMKIAQYFYWAKRRWSKRNYHFDFDASISKSSNKDYAPILDMGNDPKLFGINKDNYYLLTKDGDFEWNNMTSVDLRFFTLTNKDVHFLKSVKSSYETLHNLSIRLDCNESKSDFQDSRILSQLLQFTSLKTLNLEINFPILNFEKILLGPSYQSVDGQENCEECRVRNFEIPSKDTNSILNFKDLENLKISWNFNSLSDKLKKDWTFTSSLFVTNNGINKIFKELHKFNSLQISKVENQKGELKFTELELENEILSISKVSLNLRTNVDWAFRINRK